MTIGDILWIGVGLSMDAFAVSMSQGLCMDRIRLANVLLIAVFFGVFQALMPLFGFALGSTFSQFVTIGPWIACGLLAIIGGKMIFDGVRNKSDSGEMSLADIGKLFLLAIATSIDAFAVGISFSMQEEIVWFLGGISIFLAVGLIGVTTFLISVFGVFLGHRVGLKYRRIATIFGGAILVLIGIKIVLESYGVFGSVFSSK